MSHESTRVSFYGGTLNDEDFWAYNAQNIYLQTPTTENHCIICGQEFDSENVGNVAVIRRSARGGKASERHFRNHLRSCVEHLGFVA